MKAVGRVTAIGMDIVTMAVRVKTQHGQNVQEDDPTKHSEGEFLEKEESEGNRKCSLLACSEKYGHPTLASQMTYCAPLIPCRGKDTVKQKPYCYFLKVYRLQQGIQTCPLGLKYRLPKQKFRVYTCGQLSINGLQ